MGWSRKFTSWLIIGILPVIAGHAKAAGIEDILERMTESEQKTLFISAEHLKSAGRTTFYKINGYQALVLRQFCSEAYGSTYTGETPPVIVSGRLVRKKPKLSETIVAIAKRCNNASLVRSLLTEYWTVTGAQVEQALVTLAKLIRIYESQNALTPEKDPVEAFVWGDPITASTEAALQAKAKSEEFAEALSQDTGNIEKLIFGDLDKIQNRVQSFRQILESPSEY